MSPMLRSRLIRFFMNIWPPLWGAGIRITHIASDFRTVEVTLGLTRLNRNIVGTQFGGSLYAMCDPFFMLILMENLGKQYIVWDKAAEIRFKKPGRGRVFAKFHMSEERVNEIRAQADTQAKVEPEFTVHVLDASGTVIAEVRKRLYVRRKERA